VLIVGHSQCLPPLGRSLPSGDTARTNSKTSCSSIYLAPKGFTAQQRKRVFQLLLEKEEGTATIGQRRGNSPLLVKEMLKTQSTHRKALALLSMAPGTLLRPRLVEQAMVVLILLSVFCTTQAQYATQIDGIRDRVKRHRFSLRAHRGRLGLTANELARHFDRTSKQKRRKNKQREEEAEASRASKQAGRNTRRKKGVLLYV
jgi:hypothetical protein